MENYESGKAPWNGKKDEITSVKFQKTKPENKPKRMMKGAEESEYTGITTIGDNAFNGLEKMKTVEFTESITTIGTSAFSGCVALENVEIPQNVTTIKKNAFAQCTGLKTVTIPESVTTIDSTAFKGCSSLTEVTYNGTENICGKTKVFNETVTIKVTPDFEDESFCGSTTIEVVTGDNSLTVTIIVIVTVLVIVLCAVFVVLSYFYKRMQAKNEMQKLHDKDEEDGMLKKKNDSSSSE